MRSLRMLKENLERDNDLLECEDCGEDIPHNAPVFLWWDLLICEDCHIKKGGGGHV